MAADVPKFGDVVNSDEEDDTHTGILHSTAIGDLSGSDVAHDVSINEDEVCCFYFAHGKGAKYCDEHVCQLA